MSYKKFKILKLSLMQRRSRISTSFVEWYLHPMAALAKIRVLVQVHLHTMRTLWGKDLIDTLDHILGVPLYENLH